MPFIPLGLLWARDSEAIAMGGDRWAGSAFHSCRHRGFTLVELLVVMAIISVLAAMLLPALGKARSLSRRVACQSNEKQIAVMYTLYSADFESYFPAPYKNEFGSYWSNILYSLYTSSDGLVPLSTVREDASGETASLNYRDYLHYGSQGCQGERGTVFHCPTQSWGAWISAAGDQTTHPLSYAMSHALGSSPGSYDNNKFQYKKISRIRYPTQAFLVMDSGARYCLVFHAWLFWKFEPYAVYIDIHDDGRNILFADGHVSWKISELLPSYDNDRYAPFWTGTDP